MQQSINPIPGIFTVNDSGKKVKFAPGNLFWDGEKFNIEEHQYNFPKKWDPKHVGHFFWSRDTKFAIAEQYLDPSADVADKFFAADGGTIKGWTILDDYEWNYIFSEHIGKRNVCINGIRCLVLVPDGVAASVVSDNYTDRQWTFAVKKYGLVALPTAGLRDRKNFLSYGISSAAYWTKTPSLTEPDLAHYTSGYARPKENFTPEWKRIYSKGQGARSCGMPIRLVQNV